MVTKQRERVEPRYFDRPAYTRCSSYTPCFNRVYAWGAKTTQTGKGPPKTSVVTRSACVWLHTFLSTNFSVDIDILRLANGYAIHRRFDTPVRYMEIGSVAEVTQNKNNSLAEICISPIKKLYRVDVIE